MISVNLDIHGFDGCTLISDSTNLKGDYPSYKDLRSIVKKDDHYVLSKALYNKVLPAYVITKELCSGKYGRIYQALRIDKNKNSITTIDDIVQNDKKISHVTKDSKVNQIQHNYSNIVIKELCINVSEKEIKEKGKETATLNAIHSNLFEGVIHALVRKMFENLGLSSIVPTLYEICARTKKDTIIIPSDIECINIAMEYINGCTLQNYLNVYLTKILNAAFHEHMPESILKCRIRNEQVLLDILIQLACYLDVLQTNLRFNHRDLKINNLLVRKNGLMRYVPVIRKLIHPSLLTPYECKTDLVIIDYGFSCLACSNDNKSCLEAGSYFKNGYDCMKSGRDLALFLYSFNAIFPFVHHVSSRLYKVLDHLMMAIDNEGNIYKLLNGFNKEGKMIEADTKGVKDSVLSDKIEFDEGIYLFLRRNDIEIPNCDPIFVLETLKKEGYVL